MPAEPPHPARGSYGERRLRNFSNPAARCFQEDVGRERAARLQQTVACRPVEPVRRYLEETLADKVRTRMAIERSIAASGPASSPLGAATLQASSARCNDLEGFQRPVTGASASPSLPRRKRKDLVCGQWDLQLLPTRAPSPRPSSRATADDMGSTWGAIARTDSSPVLTLDWMTHPELSRQPWPPARAPATPPRSQGAPSVASSLANRRSSVPATHHHNRSVEKELLRTPVLMSLFYPLEAKRLSCNKYGEECRTEEKFTGFWP